MPHDIKHRDIIVHQSAFSTDTLNEPDRRRITDAEVPCGVSLHAAKLLRPDDGSIIIPKPANIGIRTFVSVGHALSAATWHTPVRVKSWSLPPLWSFQRAPEELDEEGWTFRRELVDRGSHISLLALTNSR